MRSAKLVVVLCCMVLLASAVVLMASQTGRLCPASDLTPLSWETPGNPHYALVRDQDNSPNPSDFVYTHSTSTVEDRYGATCVLSSNAANKKLGVRYYYNDPGTATITVNVCDRNGTIVLTKAWNVTANTAWRPLSSISTNGWQNTDFTGWTMRLKGKVPSSSATLKVDEVWVSFYNN